MFSQTFEYALRCVVYLARHEDAVLPIRRIAEATEIPRDYLYKLVPALHRPGLVSTRRGKRGGLRLARPADAITIFDVLTAVEPWERLQGCPLSNASRCARTGTSRRLCELHDLLDQVADSVERRLKSITLADFVRDGTVAFGEFQPHLAGRPQGRAQRAPPKRKV
jgi:Rrf2 family protein